MDFSVVLPILAFGVAIVWVAVLEFMSKDENSEEIGTMFVISDGSDKPQLLIEIESSAFEDLVHGSTDSVTLRVTRKKQSSL